MTVTPDQVLTEASTALPAGAVVTSAIAIVEYLLPGEDDADDRGPFLAFRRDSVSGTWRHLGMVTSVSDDLRADLRKQDDD
jgi:hypothetical protein